MRLVTFWQSAFWGAFGVLVLFSILFVFAGCDPLGIAKADDIPTVPDAPVQLCPDGTTVLVPGTPCPEPEPPPEPERVRVRLDLSCIQVVTPALTVECTPDTSPNGNVTCYNWGDTQSTCTDSHTYVLAGTYTIRGESCEFEVPDEFCAQDDVTLGVV